MDFLNYIKGLFNFNFPPNIRKRRVIDEFDELELFASSPKYRKVQRSLSTHMADTSISPGAIRKPARSIRNVAPPKEIIVLDDDNLRNENRLKKKYTTSTPSDMRVKGVSFQDDDDIKFVKEFKASPLKKQRESKSDSFLKPFSLLQNNIPEKRSEVKNIRTLPKPIINGTGGIKRPFMSTYTTRLDDKKEFQNLLESHRSRESSFNSSSEFFTPNSRLSKYDFSSRSGKILELSRQSYKNNSTLPLIDLTHEEINGSASPAKMTVKDKIRKVLNHYEDEETVEIQDSESDVEILPSPPSPKPDIKVDPINSMKVVVDTSYVSNKKWLADLVENHRKQLEERTKDIQQLQESTKTLNAINGDIRMGILTRQIDRCLLIKEAVLPIEEAEPELPQLTAEQYAMVDKAFRGNPSEVLVKKFNLSITRKDILTLAGLNWLNDEVINFYMNLIMERSTKESGRYPKAHCFNTFFYPKLLRDGADSLKRWTRRIDIFAMDIICVPIHLGVHWCMAIIDLRDLSIKYYDSMGSTNQKCLYALKRYLESEHMDKKKTAYDTSEYHLECVRDIPQQMNGSDCGMFSCTFAEFYSRDAKFTFKQDDMPYLRSKMVVEIITGALLIN